MHKPTQILYKNCPSGFSNVYLLGINRSKSKLVKVMKNILYDFNRFFTHYDYLLKTKSELAINYQFIIQ
jgi:hypothetical protein